MPLTRSAIKKLRKDKKREAKNEVFEKQLNTVLKKAKKDKETKQIQKAISLIDKAVKKNVYHKNKAARLKSTLSKLTATKEAKTKTTQKRAIRKVSPKRSVKK